MSFVGKKMKQSFDGVWYEGTVSYAAPYYRLTFTDGDETDHTGPDFKSLIEGVFEGARLKVHAGLPWNWLSAVVLERYAGKRKHGSLWEATDQATDSTTQNAWVVQFDNDSAWAPIDLRVYRKVANKEEGVPGSWIEAK